MKRLFSILILLFTLSCSPQSNIKKVGVDSSFYPVDLAGISQNVMGYVRDLLMEVSSESSLDLSIVDTSWDRLIYGLESGEFNACISSIPQYNFNEAKYDFSDPLLDVGLVLVTQKDAPFNSFADLSGKEVAYINGSDGDLVLEKQDVIMRDYPGYGEMLQAISSGKNEACILPRLIAEKYIANHYSDKLKIISKELTPESLRIITLKKKETIFLSKFNRALKKVDTKTLRKKFSL